MTEPTDEELRALHEDSRCDCALCKDIRRTYYQAGVASQAARIADVEARLKKHVDAALLDSPHQERLNTVVGKHHPGCLGMSRAEAAAECIEQQAARIAELEGEIATTTTVLGEAYAANEELKAERDTLTKRIAELKKQLTWQAECANAALESQERLARELAEERERSDQRQKARLIAEMTLCDREKDLAEAREELRMHEAVIAGVRTYEREMGRGGSTRDRYMVPLQSLDARRRAKTSAGEVARDDSECDGPDCSYPNGGLKCNPLQDHLPPRVGDWVSIPTSRTGIYQVTRLDEQGMVYVNGAVGCWDPRGLKLIRRASQPEAKASVYVESPETKERRLAHTVTIPGGHDTDRLAELERKVARLEFLVEPVMPSAERAGKGE